MGAPINRTAKTNLDGNLVPYTPSSSAKLKASDDVIYDYVDGLNQAQDAHAQAATLAHPDGSVKTAKIADGAITEPKYATGSVSSRAIANGAVGPSQLQTGLSSTVDVNAQFAKRGIDVTSAPYNADPTGVMDSTAAIQAVINYVESFKGKVLIPDGTYKLTTSLLIPSNITIEGISTYGVRFSMVGANAHFRNKNAATWTYAKVKNLILELGTYAFDINVTDQVSNLIFDTVICQLHTGGAMRFNKLLQTSLFDTCTFENCNSGITVQNWTTNHNLFVKCEFINLSGHCISFNEAEVNTFIGCRFENGGIPGNGSFILTNARDTHFEGCYFERIHNNLLLETTSNNSTRFDICHFTGASNGAGGLMEYSFNSDGIVQFGSNSWYTKSDGPAKMYIDGVNEGLGNNNALYFNISKNHRKFTSKRYDYPASGSIDLIKFTRALPDGALTNAQILTGKLTINYYHLEGSGFDVTYSRDYHIKVIAIGIGTIEATLTQTSAIDVVRATSLTVQLKAGATMNSATLEAIFTGVPSGLTFSQMQWSFECLSSSEVSNNYIVADLP